MIKTKHNLFNQKATDLAKHAIETFAIKQRDKLTKLLRKKYKGKIVKCTCFDHWIDGDVRVFNQELEDIQACIGVEGDLYIDVTFMLGSGAGHGDTSHYITDHLESIESVKQHK